MGFEVDYGNFNKDDFSFRGNYRAIVENNVDPEKAGRVQVRILGLHSPFASETPVEHLVWAEPCLGLYWSGGHNIENPDDKADRYRPSGNEKSMPAKSSKQLTPTSGEFKDPVEDDCGTGGYFTVPRKGSIVWIFFDNGNHNRPIYWAMSPKQQDWEEQKKKITQDVNDKRSDVNSLRGKFTPNREEHKGSGPSQNALVQTYCSKPRVNFYPIDDVENQDITSITSKRGTTFIIVNQKGKERLYLINKGTGTFISEYGHRKTIVGTTRTEGNAINSNDEELVAGHKELHIVGDYDIFANGNIFIQGESHCQLNIKKNVGIVVREGDIDIIVEKGHANVEVSNGNMNAHVAGNVQALVDKDAILKVKGNVDAEVSKDLSASISGKTSINSQGNIDIKSNANINIEASGSINMKSSNYKISAENIESKGSVQKISSAAVDVNLNSMFVVKAGSTFKVDPGGFGGDIQMSVPTSNAFHVGTFPGPGSGPSTSYTGVATPATEASPASPKSPISFVNSQKQEKVDAVVKDNEKKDKVDKEGNPDITSNP